MSKLNYESVHFFIFINVKKSEKKQKKNKALFVKSIANGLIRKETAKKAVSFLNGHM
jgi:hypothetical protein